MMKFITIRITGVRRKRNEANQNAIKNLSPFELMPCSILSFLNEFMEYASA